MGLALFSELQRHAHQRGGEEAVRVIGPLAEAHPPTTWETLARSTQRVAARLDRDLPPDAVVMLASPNRPEVLPVFLGVLASGRSVFPIDPALTPHEIRTLIQKAGAAALIADDPRRPDLEAIRIPVLPLAELSEDAAPAPAPTSRPPDGWIDRGEDAWLLLQSSGTTGGPKIVRRSGPSLDAVARNVAEAVGLRPDDRVVASVPLSHSYGIENCLLAPLVTGATMLHHVAEDHQPGRGFDPTLAVTSGATVLPGVPAMFEMIDRLGAGRGQLRLAYSAGAPLPPQLADRLEQRDGLRLGQLYGSTEIGSVTFGPHPLSVGRPMRGVDVRILDPDQPDPAHPLPHGQPGHVAVRAPSMFTRYLGPDTLTAESVVDGYFLTGDLGRLDDQDNLHITGRLKLLIDIGGVKVNPVEVEQVIASHPAVAECVVMPDPVSPTINRVKAVLTTTGGDVDQSALRSFLRERLAAHKVPRTFEVRAELPKSPTGKILRRKLQLRESA
ncbi:MAG: class I adenylate-forming enzyme family protein [Planctomycetota bacterium]